MRSRRIVRLLFVTVWCGPLLFSQVSTPKASVYFPGKNGVVWKYRQAGLDSLQHPVDSTVSIRTDTMIGFTVMALNGMESTTQWISTVTGNVPDTVKWSTYENTVKRSIDVGALFPAGTVDTLGLSRFNGTYTVMNFSAGVNSVDTLLRFDTTLTVDSTTFPARFSFTVKRLSERTMTVASAAYTVTPYVYKLAVTALYQTILGTIKVPLAELYDSTFVSKGIWIVRRVVPTTVIPASSSVLSLLGVTIPEVHVPGMLEELQTMVLGILPNVEEAHRFTVAQNYPNPFNPSTTITYVVPDRQRVTMTIYDLLGRRIAQPFDSEQEAGEHKFTFRAEGLSSGIYFYRITYGALTETKTMFLHK